MANAIETILADINKAEDDASKASTQLQRSREELVRRFAPVQVGDIESWNVDGAEQQVRVFNVQVAKSGRHGHKFVATADVLTDEGIETTNRVSCEWEIATDMPENGVDPKSGRKGAGATVAKPVPTGGRK